VAEEPLIKNGYTINIMKVNNEAFHRKAQLAAEAIKKGKIFFQNDTSEEFNRGCDHVLRLLESAILLFLNEDHSTAIFIAITAIEEIAKLQVSVFRNELRTEQATKRHEDHLFQHKSKHVIALQEVIVVGTRLPEAIGEERVRELLGMAENGSLLKMRESSLYADTVDGQFLVPFERFTKSDGRDLLLLALEVWDDRLYGLTNHSCTVDKRMTELFEQIKNIDT
jgi:AbiV family abortive infection protein